MPADDSSEEYEDDFEAYDDDGFEDDEDDDPQTVPVAAPPSKPRSQEIGRGASGRTGPWSVITKDDLDMGDLLANGAMGAVHAASWRGQRVAVKTLHDITSTLLASTEQELLLHASLSHPNIVTLHGASLSPPNCCIVMERCSCSLFEKLHKQHGELDRRSLVTMAIEVAEALAFLHSRSPPLVHRDVKSHNVLLAYGGECKLCDFGLVNAREATAGTPNYMAPELFLAKPHGVSVDVFALGVLLNEMFAREVPWDGYQPFDIKERVIKGERPPTPRTMPTAGEGLLRKMWHQIASIRPAADKVATSLRTVEQNLPVARKMAATMAFDSLDSFASMRLGATV